jgi:hypothetical protein
MRSVAIYAALLLLSAAGARAESCAEAVDQLASRYDLAAEDKIAGDTQPAPPATQESAGIAAPDTMASAGGALRPEASSRPLEPPLSGSSSTPAQPAASPQAGGSDITPMTGSQADPQHLTTAARSQAGALLQAARDQDARGKPDECFSRLHEAQSLLSGG